MDIEDIVIMLSPPVPSGGTKLQGCGSWCLQSRVTIYSDIPMHPVYCRSWPYPRGKLGQLKKNSNQSWSLLWSLTVQFQYNLYVFEIKVTIDLLLKCFCLSLSPKGLKKILFCPNRPRSPLPTMDDTLLLLSRKDI